MKFQLKKIINFDTFERKKQTLTNFENKLIV